MNVYETLTAKLIEKIEKEKRLPWQMPWNATIADGSAINGISKKAYKGFFNTTITMGWETPVFFTFKQAQEIGGSIKKGEKSTPVIYWNFIEKKNDQDEIISKFPMLKYFNVFNIDQIDFGTKKEEIYSRYEVKKNESDPTEAEKVYLDYVARENIKTLISAQASYSPTTDTIGMPNKESFISGNAYLTTAFHEAAHSTKKETRVNRIKNSYAEEEIVAELSASFIACKLGVFDETEENQSAGYLQSWIKRISSDPRAIFGLMGKAQKACEYILVEKE